FWNTAVVKRSGDVTRLQALVDKKKIVLSEDVIREILRLDDAEGVVCLPNEEIFTGLAQMGYEKPTSWNEFSIAMASAVICLSKGQKFNFSRYIFDSLVRNVDSSSKFYMYPRFIQLVIQAQVVDLSSHTTRYISPALTQKVFANMKRVGKGFSEVETPLFENILEVREVDAEEEVHVPPQDDVAHKTVIEEVAAEVVPPTPTSPLPPSLIMLSLPPHQSPRPPPPQAAEGSSLLVQQVPDKCSALVLRIEGLEHLKKVGTSQRIESSEDEENVFNQERISVDIDEGIELVDDQEKDAQDKGRQADTQAEIYNIDLDHTSKVLSMQEDTEVQEVVKVVNAAKLMTEVVTAAATQVVAASTPIPAAKLAVVDVRQPISAAKPAAKPKVLKIAAAAPAVSTKKRKGVIIRDPEEELHDDTPAETLSVKDKVKATPIGRKVLVVNYEIVMINNKPRYKIFRANDTHQLYTSFITLLKNFDREDLEDLWKIVKAKFSTSKPTNFSDDYLLVTLKNMFEKTDALDVIWRSQQTKYGQALVKSWKLLTSCGVHIITFTTTMFVLLVEKKYPLSKFTLEQLVNVARLQVEEESEMSLELLRFTRQQLLEYQQE
nr:hypothetical protein [Tanacetum cinerariifolium]